MSNAEWRWWFIIGGFVGLFAATVALINIYKTSHSTQEESTRTWLDERFETIQCTKWRGLCLCLGKDSYYGAFAFEAPPDVCGIEYLGKD